MENIRQKTRRRCNRIANLLQRLHCKGEEWFIATPLQITKTITRFSGREEKVYRTYEAERRGNRKLVYIWTKYVRCHCMFVRMYV